MKGATAYEYQIGGLVLRICHLSGAYWRWRPWRRIKFTYFYVETDPVLRFLLWLGFVARSSDKVTIDFPFHMPPRHAFKTWRCFKHHCQFHGPFYIFRNRPGVIKWIPGRLLPRRWGFGIYGFEFGDRGH